MTASPPTERSGASHQLRAIALWALGLLITLGLAGLLAWAGILLAIFGLGGVALAIAAVMTIIGLSVWRRGMLPMAVLSAALVLPAAAVALGTTRFDRSIGLLTVRPDQPSDLSTKTYRRGSGPVFVDLRSLRPAPGSTTRVKAQADNGPIIVALPHDVCLETTVDMTRDGGTSDELRQVADSSLRMIGADSGNPGGISWGQTGLAESAAFRDDGILSALPPDVADASWGLVAYGRLPIGLSRFGNRYEWTRPAATPGAAKLQLDLSASQQITVRDYPEWAAPLTDGNTDGYEQVSSVSWPTGLSAPVSPGNQAWKLRASVRTPENRARWVKWEREVVKWGAEQARRYAGPCATRQQLEDRAFMFFTQPEAIKTKKGVERLYGGPTTRRSAIRQPVAKAADSMLVVEVNGLGNVQVLGENRPSLPYGADGRTKAQLENDR